jgi:hypothetical protein
MLPRRGYEAIISAVPWPDDVPVPAFGPRMVFLPASLARAFPPLPPSRRPAPNGCTGQA